MKELKEASKKIKEAKLISIIENKTLKEALREVLQKK